MPDLTLANAIAERTPLNETMRTHRTDSLRLERIEPERNMARYYTLAVELTLFDDWSCTRGFGRIGARGGRIMLGLFEDRAAAEAELIALLRAKQARGYRITST
jgi:predicted DNA-binding WGR domain protein